MLPAAHRLRQSTDFSQILAQRRRAGRETIVVNLGSLGTDATSPVRIGLIVGKGVGPSVVRHQVSRRLRAQLAEVLGSLPTGSGLVVRALPAAAEAPSSLLRRDLDSAIRRLTRPPVGAEDG